MRFVKVPAEYASAFGELLYTVEGVGGEPFDAEIMDVDSGETLGVKRYSGMDAVELNAALYVRSALAPQPAMSQRTGLWPVAGRGVMAAVRVGEEVSPGRFFTAATCGIAPMQPLSLLPSEREIGFGEADEMGFLLPAGNYSVSVAVAEPNGDAVMPAIHCIVTKEGMFALRIDMEEVAQWHEGRGVGLCECNGVVVTLLAGEEAVFTCRYAVKRYAAEVVRLCWLNSLGGFDCFTFPAVSEGVEGEVKRILSADGPKTVAAGLDRLMEIGSGYLPAGVMRALSEILTSPLVWRVCGGELTPVVVEEKKTAVRGEELVCFKVTVREPARDNYQTF